MVYLKRKLSEVGSNERWEPGPMSHLALKANPHIVHNVLINLYETH
jgi:hypothetical protein